MDPTPLAQIINLRGQAEKASKTQQLYTKRVGGWCEWSDVQKARQHALEKLKELSGKSLADQRSALRDATAISLLSLIPPDRVSCRGSHNARSLLFGSPQCTDWFVHYVCATLRSVALGSFVSDIPSRRKMTATG